MELVVKSGQVERAIRMNDYLVYLLRPSKGHIYRVKIEVSAPSPQQPHRVIQAQWWGREVYQTEIETRVRKVVRWHCTCPAAQYIQTGKPVRGFYACKHAIATVYLLRKVSDFAPHWQYQLETGEVICPDCELEDTPGLCPECGGTGYGDDGACDSCGGSGLCDTCNGAGYVGGAGEE